MEPHPVDESQLPREERKYREYMVRGDDFYKIDLFLSAGKMYQKALEYKPGDELAKQKYEQCRSNIRRDTKRVIITLSSLAVLFGIIIVLVKFL